MCCKDDKLLNQLKIDPSFYSYNKNITKTCQVVIAQMAVFPISAMALKKIKLVQNVI